MPAWMIVAILAVVLVDALLLTHAARLKRRRARWRARYHRTPPIRKRP